jgi:predicted CoA-binding protein
MTTLVIGASENPSRYSYKAVELLRKKGYDVIAIGNRSGRIQDVAINTEQVIPNKIDTITLYISSKNQEYLKYKIIQARPRRVIFNPGAENETFLEELKQNGIETLNACTLVMLTTGQY